MGQVLELGLPSTLSKTKFPKQTPRIKMSTEVDTKGSDGQYKNPVFGSYLSLLPRSQSPIPIAFALACYSYFTTRSLLGLFLLFFPEYSFLGDVFTNKNGTFLDGLFIILISPLVESLVLIGALESARLMRCPKRLAAVIGTLVLVAYHATRSIALGCLLAPLFATSAVFYVTFPKPFHVALAVLFLIHVLYNTPAFLSSIGG